jgi:ribonuclease BN (tRNA processing enzyme)
MTPPTRRSFILSSGLSVATLALAAERLLAQQPTPATRPTPVAGRDRLVLLGTKGGPFVSAYAPAPSSNLLVHRGSPYVVDAGYGVTFKLIDAGVMPALVRHVFITHHHSDHNIELGPLLYNAWVGGLKAPIEVHGPAGLDALIAAYWESNRFDIETRIVDEGRPDPRQLVTTHEYHEGTVLETADLRVTALRNLHPPITDSFALKFELACFGEVDAEGRSRPSEPAKDSPTRTCATQRKTVVFSGDTTYFPPLAAFAANADYLIHEVMYGPAMAAVVRRTANGATLLEHLQASHTLPADVGRIAAAANVRTLVLNHLVPPTGFVFDGTTLTAEMWIEAVRATFAGTIIVGRDLLELPL